MIMFSENPKSPTDKLLELINEFSKVAEHKMNIQKINCLAIYNNKQVDN